jgi:hypothetical protein
VVWADRFKKYLKMIFGWPCLVLEVPFGSCYALLIGVTSFLVTVAVTGYNDDMMGSPLLPFLAAHGAFEKKFHKFTKNHS